MKKNTKIFVLTILTLVVLGGILALYLGKDSYIDNPSKNNQVLALEDEISNTLEDVKKLASEADDHYKNNHLDLALELYEQALEKFNILESNYEKTVYELENPEDDFVLSDETSNKILTISSLMQEIKTNISQIKKDLATPKASKSSEDEITK